MGVSPTANVDSKFPFPHRFLTELLKLEHEAGSVFRLRLLNVTSELTKIDNLFREKL